MSLGHSIPPRIAYAARDGICPRCSGVAHRVRRRPIDRFINIFVPVYRYRCGSLDCNWEGNLLARKEPLQK
jgi:hypothetical protein